MRPLTLRRPVPAAWPSRAVVLLSLGVSVACSKSDNLNGPAGQLHSIVISPAADSIAVGGSQTFTATGQDASGHTITGLKFFWQSSSKAVATVTSSGQVTAVATGLVQISASFQGVSGIANVTVTPKPVGSIVVVPSAATLRVATTLQLSDTVKDASGHVLTGQTVTWSSDTALIAAVDQNGLVTARALGVAHITASSGGKSAISMITVSQVPVASVTVNPAMPSVFVGQTTQLSAVAKDSAGNVLPGRVVRWSTTNTAVATIDSVAGVLTGVAQGNTYVRARSEGIVDSVVATVSPAPPSTVILSPALAQVDVGQTVSYSAVVTDASGNPIPNPTVNYSSLSPSIASVTSQTGATAQVLAGPNSGTVTIKGISGAATGNATIIVSLVGVDSVHIATAHDTLNPPQSETFTATAYDSSGNVLSGRPVSWQSSNPAVATVVGAGPTSLVTAQSTGVAVIFATISGVKGSLALIVNPVPVGSVTLSRHTDTLQVLGQLQLTATVRDINNNIINPPQTWYSTNTSIAVVTSSGLVTGVGSGSPGIIPTMIIDSVGGKADTNTTWVLAPITSVAVAPSTATITTIQTQPLTAQLGDNYGDNNLTGRTVAWTSSNLAVDTVSQSGIVYPVAPGTDTIKASVSQPTGNVSGTAVITVTQDPVATVIVYPTPDTIYASAPGNTVQLHDSTKDVNGTYLPGRAVTWSVTGNPQFAGVNASGLVTGSNNNIGQSTVTATSSDGPTGNATIVVRGHTQSLTVTIPAPDTLSQSGSAGPTFLVATVTVLDTFGNPVESTRPVMWQSSDGTTVTINGSASPVVTTAGASVTLAVTSTLTPSSPVTITATAADNPSATATPGQVTIVP